MASRPPKAEVLVMKDEKDEKTIPSLDGLRQEYTEINNNIRHYSLVRFTALTVYIAAFSGVTSVAFGFFVPQSGTDETLKLGGRIAGLLITILFSQYEYLIVEVLNKNRERGRELEAHLGYKQITLRSQAAISVSQYIARFFYYILLLFWLLTIIRLTWIILRA